MDSSVPALLNAPILFIDSIGFQSFILLFTGIYSIVCLGSGLKQVHNFKSNLSLSDSCVGIIESNKLE